MRRLTLFVLLGSSALAPVVSPIALAANASVIAAAEQAAPDLLLAEVYGPAVDPALYWVSEKLDGVRAFWDGHQLRFRSGRRVNAPPWFVAALPAEPLDGELWLGRGRFDELSGIVRKDAPVDAEWRQLRYMIYELPGMAGRGGNYGERIEGIKATVGRAGQPWLQAVAQFRVADHAALATVLAEVVAGEGEGLMLHRADAAYLTGRNAALLKLKPTLDAEATVVGYIAGKGRLAGRVGALQMQMADGTRFRLGSGLSDADRRDPPPLGSRVSFRYQSLSKRGVPRFPRYWRRELL